MAEDWITTMEAVDISGYHPEYIRRLTRKGVVKAHKFGTVWQVSRVSLLTYLRKADSSEDQRKGPR
jgi:hypothetical protein